MMSATPLKKPKERIRRFRPKSKHGCITCKVRHVKCDETRPECLRCQKFGAECEGYDTGDEQPSQPVQPTRTKSIQIPRPLAPKTPSPGTGVPLMCTTLCPIGARSWNEDEYRYYRLFCEHTAFSLSGYFKGSLWERIVLQACESSLSIKRLAIALATLDRAMHLPYANDRRQLTTQGVHDYRQTRLFHHQSALRQYQNAIRGMVEWLKSNRRDTRTALIFCLLVICFETWIGNVSTAMAQLSNGMQLISEWLKEGFSPLPSFDQELVEVFDRLENNAIMSLSNKHLRRKPEFRYDMHELVMSMPVTFSTVEEARLHYEIQLRTLFNSPKQKAAVSSTTPKAARPSFHPHFMTRPSDYEPENHERTFRTWLPKVERFHAWHAAFVPLLERIRAAPHPEQNPSYLAALAIELRYTGAFILLPSNTMRHEVGWDASNPLFASTVALAETMVLAETTAGVAPMFRTPGPEVTPVDASFCIDGTIIPALYIVVTRCRSPGIRRRAIALLERRPRREAMWDAEIVARIGRLIMGIEEVGMPMDGVVEEHKRIRGLEVEYNMMERSGRLGYLEMDPRVDEDRPLERFIPRCVDFTW